MKLVILLVLIISILALTTAAWNINSSTTDRYPLKGRSNRHQQMDNIRRSTDIALLKEQAIDLVLNIDEQAIENERASNKVQTLLILTIFLTCIMLMIAYFEIAARGKIIKRSEQKLPPI